MASAMVLSVVNRTPATGGLEVTYEVAFVRDNATLDIDQITVTLAPADTTNNLVTKLGAAVRDRAIALGYSVPSNGVILPSYAKG